MNESIKSTPSDGFGFWVFFLVIAIGLVIYGYVSGQYMYIGFSLVPALAFFVTLIMSLTEGMSVNKRSDIKHIQKNNQKLEK